MTRQPAPVPVARSGGTHRAVRRRPAPPVLLVVAVLLALVPALGLAVLVVGGTATEDDAAPAAGTPGAPDGAAVVRAWDAARSSAYARGDATALRALYVDGSALGEQDVAVLAAYDERGLRLHGVGFELVDARVAETSTDRVVVVVTERLQRADVRRVDGTPTGVRTPAAAPVERELTFAGGGDGGQDGGEAGWRLAGIRPSGPAPP